MYRYNNQTYRKNDDGTYDYTGGVDITEMQAVIEEQLSQTIEDFDATLLKVAEDGT